MKLLVNCTTCSALIKEYKAENAFSQIFYIYIIYIFLYLSNESNMKISGIVKEGEVYLSALANLSTPIPNIL